MNTNLAISPLTNEELDTFRAMIGIQRNDATVQIITKFTEALSQIVQQNSDMIKDFRLFQLEQTDKISALLSAKSEPQTNPIFYCSMNAADQQLWREKVTGQIAQICLDDHYNKGSVYRKIYDGMKRNGYDVGVLLKEYCRDNNCNISILDMCAKSDVLRLSLQNQINVIFHNKIVDNVKEKYSKKKKVDYASTRRVPKEVREIIDKMSRSGVANGRTFNNAENMMAKSGFDINKLEKRVAKKYKIKNCNKWFAVSQSAEAIEVLNNVVNKYLEEKNA